jgi:hypothetical protein
MVGKGELYFSLPLSPYLASKNDLHGVVFFLIYPFLRGTNDLKGSVQRENGKEGGLECSETKGLLL